jgi:putative FmdB family regulatory protein
VKVPLYEYKCAGCEHEFESLVSAGQADQATCPACGTGDVRRLLSLFAAPRGGESAWSASGPAIGGDGASAPTGCCGGACGHC